DDDMTGTCMFGDGHGHDADRPGASDQHIFAQHRKGKCRMSGITERVKNGGDVQVNIRTMMPDIRHRYGNELGECARTIHADALGVFAQVTAAREAVTATATDDVAFGANDFTGEKI